MNSELQWSQRMKKNSNLTHSFNKHFLPATGNSLPGMASLVSYFRNHQLKCSPYKSFSKSLRKRRVLAPFSTAL